VIRPRSWPAWHLGPLEVPHGVYPGDRYCHRRWTATSRKHRR